MRKHDSFPVFSVSLILTSDTHTPVSTLSVNLHNKSVIFTIKALVHKTVQPELKVSYIFKRKALVSNRTIDNTVKYARFSNARVMLKFLLKSSVHILSTLEDSIQSL